MKRWMENKVGRQKAYRKFINGMSERFAPESKTAKALVAYSLTTKPTPATYDLAMVRKVKPSKAKAVKHRTYGDDRRTWDHGSTMSRCYGWNDYAQVSSQLIKAR